MTEGEEEPKKGEGIGFAGLSSLVSEVDMTPPPAVKNEPAAAAPRAERSAPPPAQPQPRPPQPSQRETYQAPAQPSSGSSGGKWVLGIAAVIGLFSLISLFNKNTDPTAPAYTPSTQTINSEPASAPSRTNELVTPKFNDYLSEIYEGSRASVNLLTDFDRNFKTRIRKTQSQPVNFSGDYVLSTWGCGTSCLMGVAVNARTGQVVELPGSVCCWRGAGEGVIFRKNSRLLVLAGLINETGQHGAHFYELKNNEFVHIKTIPVKEDEPGNTSSALAPAPLAPTYSPAPTQPQEPSRPAEDRPPVGQNLVLSTAQIRYCLAEDIRMDGAKSAVNNYIDSDVDRFNAMVADYNSRCGSFRYRSGALESARRDVELYRSQLQAEGRSRFARSPSTGSLSTPAPARPTSDATVQAIQSKLNELGYEAGAADGLIGRVTRSAILAFQRDNGLVTDGNPTVALLQVLTASRQVKKQGESQLIQPSAPPVAVVPPTYTPSTRSPTRRESAGSKVNGIPQNARLNYLGNDWECNRGYYKYGNGCHTVQIPQNGKLTYLGNDWECNRSYYKYGDVCHAVQIPQNGKLTYLGNDWECNRGYYKYGNGCHTVQIPQNGKLTYLGNDWECNRGYYKYGNGCHTVQIPQNGKLTYLGNDWECEKGYRKAGDKCMPVYTQ